MNLDLVHKKKASVLFSLLVVFGVQIILFQNFEQIPQTDAFQSSQSALSVNNNVTWSVYRKQIGFKPGQNVTIPSGMNLIFDGSGTEDQINKLWIRGGFICAPGDRTLEARAILVQGTGAFFQCGTDVTPRVDPFKIHLSGQVSFSHSEMMSGCKNIKMDNMPMHDSGYQGFAVVCGAGLVLKGYTPQAYLLWTRLKSTAQIGARQIILQSKVPWPVNSQIVIASSDFDHTQAEQRTLVGYDSNTGALLLDQPLKFRHWGAPTQHYTAGTTSLPLINQAEVALLTRPILFQGTEYTDSTSVANQTDKKGAHLMFMSGPGDIRVNGVEFETVGRMGELGRYPIHWHKVGDHLNPATGKPFLAYIKNSSIHHSFNRCVTVHETNMVKVLNNVCYDHYGHGFFLEEGNEVNNIFIHNLGLLSKAVPIGREILSTDRITNNPSRFSSPATYWISNPNNVYMNNVAAGSDGVGFWFALKDQTHMPDLSSTAPVNTDLLKFEGNLAHSSQQGLSVDGGPNGTPQANPRNYFDMNCLEKNADSCQNPNRTQDQTIFDRDTADFTTAQTVYTPAKPALINRFTAYKCRDFGLWFSNRGNSIVQNSIFADNQLAVALVFDSALKDSVIIAQTSNYIPNSLLPKTTKQPDSIQFAGTLVYDGPTSMENVKFEGFPEQMTFTSPAIGTQSGIILTYKPKIFMMTSAASDRSPVHRMQKITFGTNMPSVLADLQHDLGHYSKDNWSAGVWDIDGSLTGHANYTIVPHEAISNVSGCLQDSRFANALICPGQFGQIFFAATNKRFDLFRKNTATGIKEAQFIIPSQYIDNSKVPAVSGDNAHIDMVTGAPYINHQFSFPLSQVTKDTYVVRLYPQEALDTSLVPSWMGFSNPLIINNLSAAISLNANWLGQGEQSPPIEIYQMGRNCRVLNAGTVSGVKISESDGDVVKLQFTAINAKSNGWEGQNYESSSVALQCYVPTAISMLSPTIERSGAWYLQGNSLIGTSNAVAGSAQFTAYVTGKNLKLNAGLGESRGIARVTIDNRTPIDFDLYANGYKMQDLTIATGLPDCAHKVVIEYTGRKNTNSTGAFVVLNSLSAF